MKIYVDTADIEEIKTAFAWGIVDGVTTNPSLIKKAVKKYKKGLKEYIKEILKIAGKTPVSLEIISVKEKEMYEQAVTLYEMFSTKENNIVIKIPINIAEDKEDTTHYDALKVINKLAKKKIPVNCTLIMTPEQSLLAAKAGASYVSPFAGRIDDDLRKRAGREFEKTDYHEADGIMIEDVLVHDKGIVSGVDLVEQTQHMLRTYKYNTQVIAASVRNARQVRELALIGADIATIPFSVLNEMIHHHKTFEGLKAFTNDIVPEYEKLFE